MKSLFDMENPVMRALNVVADLMLLNLLTILCCLPVFTAGASFAALNHAVLLRIRGEETGMVKDFLRGFRLNFKRGIGLGLFFLVLVLLLLADYLAADLYIPMLRPVTAALGVLTLAVSQYAFALLVRYENTLWGTMKNALLLSIACFPRTVVMVVFTMVLWMLAVQFILYGAPILFLCGFSLPCYMVMLLVQPVFANLENRA